MSEMSRRLLRDALQARMSGDSPHCLDPETLAAWADDTLSRRERAAIEAHAASCARCQAMLAAMARTTLPAPPRSWFRASIVGWALPVTAAVALLVWILAPPRMRAPSAPAANAVAVSGLPAGKADAVTTPNAAPADALRDTTERPPTGSSASASGQRQLGPASSSGDALTTDLRAKKEGRRSRAGREGEAQESDKVAAREETAAGVTSRDAKALPSQARVAQPAEPPAPPPPAPPSAAATPAPAPSAPPAAAPASGLAGRLARSSAQDAAARGGNGERLSIAPQRQMAIVIVSVVHNTQWQIMPDGMVQRSIDGGATWTQSTRASVAPTAGASPSPLVCWLVGPQGLVLLTTDGTSWKRLAFPEAIALTRVQASDEKTATVTAANGRTFSTTDGGVTWTSQ